MVTERQAVSTGIEKVLGDFFRQAETASGVLGIDDHEVEFELLAQAGQVVAHSGAARLSDNVSEKG